MIRAPALPRFLLLYAALYAAFGVASPFLPTFLRSRGITPEEIAVVLATATAMRMVTGPLAGRAADATHRWRRTLAICSAAGAVSALLYLPAHHLGPLLCVSLLSAAALAPLAPLADAMALGAAEAPASGFAYGWVRGAGSAAFIAGSVVAGQMTEWLGLFSILWLQAVLLSVTAIIRVPELIGSRNRQELVAAHVSALFRISAFRRMLLVAALVLGSHAMHDAFAVIRWTGSGISPATASLLWSEAVGAEVIVFVILGPPAVTRFGPAACFALAAAAGIVRWAAMALSVRPAILAAVEPLHGLTFALLHLAAMRLIGEIVPASLAATAQAIYGTIAIGGMTALLTLGSGWLYQHFDGRGFWAMAVLCALALPLAAGTRVPNCANRRGPT